MRPCVGLIISGIINIRLNVVAIVDWSKKDTHRFKQLPYPRYVSSIIKLYIFVIKKKKTEKKYFIYLLILPMFIQLYLQCLYDLNRNCVININCFDIIPTVWIFSNVLSIKKKAQLQFQVHLHPMFNGISLQLALNVNMILCNLWASFENQNICFIYAFINELILDQNRKTRKKR